MTQDILQQLKSIKTATELEGFEKEHRDDIIGGSVELRIIFDTKWKDLKGSFYFQPVTSVPPPVKTGSTMHPKAAKYRTIKRAKGIIWKKITEPRKAGKNYRNEDFFNLIAQTDGGNQTIAYKFDKDQVLEFCGRKIADAIMKESKNATDGILKNLNDDVSCVGYWEVVFHPKSHENDTPDVLLNANGLALQMQREKNVIVPGTHLNVADDGVWLKYHEEPGVARKVVGKIQFYGYTPIREASEEEFYQHKAAGDKIEAEEKRKKEFG